jgi:RNA polymerase sigma factor (sigma-70 family)
METLLRDLRPAVVRTVRLILGPGRAASEDAAQDALIDIYRGLPKLRDPAAIEAWALRVATRRAIRAARLERLRLASLVPLGAAPHRESQASRVSSDLARAFYHLPPRQRAVAVLRLYLGLTEVEVSAALGCSVGTVKSQLHDARTRLQAAIQKGTT